MKNRELFIKMERDLKGYQFGLHNIGIDKYKSIMCCYSSEIRKRFEFTGAEISEKSIADNIVKTGLSVLDRAMGLRSTVMPVEVFNENSFDYTYNELEVGTIWNVIVALPRFIKYKEQEYYIGDIISWVNVANMLMFNPSIFKEFIYGYYSKEITERHVNQKGQISHSFSDELEFFSNPSFFENLDDNEKNLVMKRLFEENRRLLSNLKLANNNSKLGMLFRTSYEKFVINKTREQVKRLSYGKKKITTIL